MTDQISGKMTTITIMHCPNYMGSFAMQAFPNSSHSLHPCWILHVPLLLKPSNISSETINQYFVYTSINTFISHPVLFHSATGPSQHSYLPCSFYYSVRPSLQPNILNKNLSSLLLFTNFPSGWKESNSDITPQEHLSTQSKQLHFYYCMSSYIHRLIGSQYIGSLCIDNGSYVDVKLWRSILAMVVNFSNG